MDQADLSPMERIPPQSLEAEVSVLGAMMMAAGAIPEVIEILPVESFYKDSHRRIYAAMIELFERNEPVDLTTLTNRLRDKGELESAGGAANLASILNSVPTAANVTYYARIVFKKFLLRKLIATATEIVGMGYAEEKEVDLVLDQAEQLIFDIAQRKISRGVISVADMLHDSFEAIERLYAHKEHVTGLASGFRDFDIMTSGFQKSDLIIIAGRPSMGKSSLALNIAQHVGIREATPVALFSLEMSADQLVQRMLCAEARVDAHRLRTGFLSESDWPKLTTAAGVLSKSKIFIDDTPAITVLDVRAKTRRLMAKEPLGLIIIDYLQLMQSRREFDSRQQEISEISRSLKALARELNIPVIALSQLSRAVETRSDRRPQLADLRESGAIEQDADLVVFVYREEYYRPTPENEGMAEVIIGKQRNGPVGTVKLAFIKKYTRFENLAKVEEEKLAA